MMTDPISDMVIRIRNASCVGKASVRMPHSKLKKEIARVLHEEGYVKSVSEVKEGAFPELVIELKYIDGKVSVLRGMTRESRPGGRRYVAKDEIYQVADGYGSLILTTPKGVMTGAEAMKIGVGGEALLKVW